MKVNLKNISFVLVEPKNAGNIGSLSRLCKNMGISSVYLVNPCDYQVPQTTKLGWAAEDVLQEMKTISSLDEIFPKVQILIGTTNRMRKNMSPLFTPKEIIEKMIPLSQDNKIAFVFGRENNGLSNEELSKCHFISTIPMACTYPAINLAQAAMVYAYELYQMSIDKNFYSWVGATKLDEEKLYEKLAKTIQVLPIIVRRGEENFISLFRRILGRTVLEQRDIRLLHRFFDLIISAKTKH